MSVLEHRLFFAALPAIALVMACSVRAELAVSDWTDAAEGRVQAAQSLESKASGLMDRAEKLKGKDFLYDSERQSNYKKAGKAEMKAGRLRLASSHNFLKAADNWENAAELASNGEGTEGADERTIRKRVNDAFGEAAEALLLAAESFDAAAGTFSDDKISEPELAEKAAEKAAEARERASGLRSN